MHKHLRLPPFTRLREFMQGNDITPASVYATGIISRRRLLDLLNGTGQPALRTAIALARHFADVLHRPVWVGELFDIGDESVLRHTIVRLAREVGVAVGWVLGEQGFEVGPTERDELRHVAQLILDITADWNQGS